MRTRGIVTGAGLLALASGLLITPTAGATAPPPTLAVHPAVVAPGQGLTFAANCAGTATAVTSAGLTGPVNLKYGSGNLVGHGRAVAKPGRYTAQFSCASAGPFGSGTPKVTFEVACPKPTKPPVTTPPATTPTEPTKTTQPTAPGTPAPGGGGGAAPGHPVESCGGGTTTPPPPPVKKPAKPQVAVTPKGAPQTGDGSLATS